MKRIASIWLATVTLLLAAPGAPGVHEIKQPDGTTFKGELQGDEWLNWIALDNGYVALYNNASRQYEYAVVATDGSSMRLSPSGHAVAANQHAPSAGAPATSLPAAIRPISPEELGAIWKARRAALKRLR